MLCRVARAGVSGGMREKMRIERSNDMTKKSAFEKWPRNEVL